MPPSRDDIHHCFGGVNNKTKPHKTPPCETTTQILVGLFNFLFQGILNSGLLCKENALYLQTIPVASLWHRHLSESVQPTQRETSCFHPGIYRLAGTLWGANAQRALPPIASARGTAQHVLRATATAMPQLCERGIHPGKTLSACWTQIHCVHAAEEVELRDLLSYKSPESKSLRLSLTGSYHCRGQLPHRSLLSRLPAERWNLVAPDAHSGPQVLDGIKNGPKQLNGSSASNSRDNEGIRTSLDPAQSSEMSVRNPRWKVLLHCGYSCKKGIPLSDPCLSPSVSSRPKIT